MSAPSGPVPPGQRYPLLDALRGFALLGILLVNMEGYATALEGAGWGDFDGVAKSVLERVVAFVPCEASSGSYMLELDH